MFRLWNALSMQRPIYEMSYLWHVLSMKCLIYELSYLWIVISMKCPVYEMSYLWSVLSMKYFSMKWPNTILSVCVLCSTVHLAISGSKSAQYMIWTGEIQWCCLEQNIILPIFIYFCKKQKNWITKLFPIRIRRIYLL